MMHHLPLVMIVNREYKLLHQVLPLQLPTTLRRTHSLQRAILHKLLQVIPRMLNLLQLIPTMYSLLHIILPMLSLL